MCDHAGPAHQISIKKHVAITVTSASTKDSITRIPMRVNHSTSNVSAAVRRTPVSTGM